MFTSSCTTPGKTPRPPTLHVSPKTSRVSFYAGVLAPCQTETHAPPSKLPRREIPLLLIAAAVAAPIPLRPAAGFCRALPPRDATAILSPPAAPTPLAGLRRDIPPPAPLRHRWRPCRAVSFGQTSVTPRTSLGSE